MLKEVSTTIMVIEGLLLLIPTLFLDTVGSIGYLIFWMLLTAAINLILVIILLNSELERKGNFVGMLVLIPILPIFLMILIYSIKNK